MKVCLEYLDGARRQGWRLTCILLLFFNFVASYSKSNETLLQTSTALLYYMSDAGTYGICVVTLVNSKPITFLGTGTCMYDDWGNFIGQPQSFYISNGKWKMPVKQIFLHPHFWFTNTQNNIALFVMEPRKNDVDIDFSRFIVPIAKDQQEPSNCSLIAFNPITEEQSIYRFPEVVDRDKYCYKQMFPAVLQLRYDNICVTIPYFPVSIEFEKRYDGSPLICISQDNEIFLYATLSFTYTCENLRHTAIFTKVSYHRDFILQPTKVITGTIEAYRMRRNVNEQANSSRVVNLNLFAKIIMIFLMQVIIVYE